MARYGNTDQACVFLQMLLERQLPPNIVTQTPAPVVVRGAEPLRVRLEFVPVSPATTAEAGAASELLSVSTPGAAPVSKPKRTYRKATNGRKKRKTKGVRK